MHNPVRKCSRSRDFGQERSLAAGVHSSGLHSALTATGSPLAENTPRSRSGTPRRCRRNRLLHRESAACPQLTNESLEKVAGEVSPPSKALTGLGIVPAQGLRAGGDGVFIVPRTAA